MLASKYQFKLQIREVPPIICEKPHWFPTHMDHFCQCQGSGFRGPALLPYNQHPISLNPMQAKSVILCSEPLRRHIYMCDLSNLEL